MHINIKIQTKKLEIHDEVVSIFFIGDVTLIKILIRKENGRVRQKRRQRWAREKICELLANRRKQNKLTIYKDNIRKNY